MRPDRLPLRARRQPPLEPLRRPHPARPAVPRHRRAPRQEHHRRRAPARRPLRPRRGPDARPGRARAPLVGRDRGRLRSRLPCRRGAGQRPARARLPTGHRAHPGHDRAGRIASRTSVSPTCPRPGTCTTTSAAFAGYGRLSGNALEDLRAGHRGEVEADKRDPADFALWKAAGPERELRWPSAALGRRLPGLASRVLGDGPALSRRPVRHPHRRHRQRLPAPRGRDRPVGAARRRATGHDVGPRGASC